MYANYPVSNYFHKFYLCILSYVTLEKPQRISIARVIGLFFTHEATEYQCLAQVHGASSRKKQGLLVHVQWYSLYNKGDHFQTTINFNSYFFFHSTHIYYLLLLGIFISYFCRCSFHLDFIDCWKAMKTFLLSMKLYKQTCSRCQQEVIWPSQ